MGNLPSRPDMKMLHVDTFAPTMQYLLALPPQNVLLGGVRAMVLWKSRSSQLHSLEHLGDIPEVAVVNCAGDDDAAVPNSETHWQTPATLLPFVRALDEVMNPLGPVYKKAKKPSFLEVFSVTCALVFLLACLWSVSFFVSLMAACHFLLVFVFHTVRNFPFHLEGKTN